MLPTASAYPPRVHHGLPNFREVGVLSARIRCTAAPRGDVRRKAPDDRLVARSRAAGFGVAWLPCSGTSVRPRIGVAIAQVRQQQQCVLTCGELAPLGDRARSGAADRQVGQVCCGQADRARLLRFVGRMVRRRSPSSCQRSVLRRQLTRCRDQPSIFNSCWVGRLNVSVPDWVRAPMTGSVLGVKAHDRQVFRYRWSSTSTASASSTASCRTHQPNTSADPRAT